MPSNSAAQHKLALIAAHHPGGYGGMPQSVGREFMNADARSGRFAAGGAAMRASNLARTMARGRLADGGMYMPPRPSFSERYDIRDVLSPTAGGVIASEIPGRTDHIPTSVAADSYVVPADVVSGLGEGNTLAGARFIQEALTSGPHGIPMPRLGGRADLPRPPAPYRGPAEPHAKGGTVAQTPKAPLKTADIRDKPGEVPVVLAGGEVVIDPYFVAHHPLLGALPLHDRDPKHYREAVNFGHKALDAWVVHERKKHIKTLKSLPPPKK